MADQHAPAGWYDDSTGTGARRYWDGQAWTEHVQAPAPRVDSGSPVSPATPETRPAAPQPAASAPQAPAPARSRGPLVLGISIAAVTVLVIGGIIAWGPVSAILRPTATLSESSFFQNAVDSLEEMRSPEIPAAAYPAFDNTRQSPGFRDAINVFIDEQVAAIDGDMQFDSKADADEYAYSTAYADAVDLAAGLQRGGLGTPLATTSFPQSDAILAIEQEIASIPVEAGADGTYWETADRIAAVAGSTITQDLSLNTCIGGNSTIDPAAFFCANEENWDQVFFTPLGVQYQSTPGVVDVLKHELAHKLIHVQCAGAIHALQSTWHATYGEGVTNSYATLYLGADPANLSQQDDYLMTPETDAMARAVHEGDLACYDGGVLPGE